MNWYDGLTLGKLPDTVIKYQLTWTDWLNGETIASSVVTSDSGLTVDSYGNTDTVVTMTLSGGTIDTTYNVRCAITTASQSTYRDITIDCGQPPGEISIRSCP